MSLQTIVSESPLSAEDKKELLQRLELEGATPDVVAAIKAALQDYIDSGFKTLGIEPDPNDPRIQAIQSKLEQDIAAVHDEYTEELENLSIDAAVAQAQGNKKVEKLQVDLVKMQMAA